MSTLQEVWTETPTSTAEAAALLGSSRGTVLVRGAASALDWGGSVAPVDLVVDTGGLGGDVEHNPADLTVAVGAGTRLADLQELLRAAGQWLPFDPPSEADGATLAGLLATGEPGPSRLRHGPLRDLVIGSTLVLADGTVAHSGGHVIKNVAGYDLTKITAGSLGSLALVTELVLRVHPLPAATCTLRARTGLAAASAAALRLLSSTVEAAALEWSSDGGGGVDGEGGDLLVRVDGTGRRVGEAPGLLARTLGGLDPGLELLDAEEAATAWADHAARTAGAGRATTVGLQVLPDRVPALVAAVRTVADAHDRSVVLSGALGVGTVTAAWSDPGDGTDAASRTTTDLLVALRAAATAHGAGMLLRRRPAGLVVDGSVALGPPPSSAPLLRRLKATLDPTGRLAPGRFEPWY